MRRLIIGLTACLAGIVAFSNAQAALITIGTVDYDSGFDGIADVFGLNLIWDDDNNGKSLVWLDHSNPETNWSVQNSWAATLGPRLSNFNTPGYNVNWSESTWRLPSAGPDPLYADNQITAEMGHLFYVELGFQSWSDRGFTYLSSEDINTSNFDQLTNGRYWALEGDHSPGGSAWYFDNFSGGLGSKPWQFNAFYGLAVREAQVSTVVPEPSTIWLLGPGLLALCGIRRKKQELEETDACRRMLFSQARAFVPQSSSIDR